LKKSLSLILSDEKGSMPFEDWKECSKGIFVGINLALRLQAITQKQA
jgi:hypothetical protein